MNRLVSVLDSISTATALCVRWLVLAMLLIQFAIVIGRYVFGVYSIAVQEAVLYMHASVFMLGAAYTLLLDKHVRVDIVYSRVSAKTRRRIDLCGHLFLLMPSMSALLYWSWPSVANSWKILEGPLSVGGIKAVFLLKSLIAAFCVLVLLQSLSMVIRLAQTRD